MNSYQTNLIYLFLYYFFWCTFNISYAQIRDPFQWPKPVLCQQAIIQQQQFIQQWSLTGIFDQDNVQYAIFSHASQSGMILSKNQYFLPTYWFVEQIFQDHIMLALNVPHLCQSIIYLEVDLP